MEAGDCIFIPIGWYHHVRSVAPPAFACRVCACRWMCVCCVLCVFCGFSDSPGELFFCLCSSYDRNIAVNVWFDRNEELHQGYMSPAVRAHAIRSKRSSPHAPENQR